MTPGPSTRLDRIIIVCGARVLADSADARSWAKGIIATRIVSGGASVVAHGGAIGPDSWADELASWLDLPRVVFALRGRRAVLVVGGRVRDVRHAERYAYDSRDPLGRNGVLMRWSADRAAEGHEVSVLALHAPWSSTQGTAHAARMAREIGLQVMEFTAPPEMRPTGGT